jgi:hypothetical protein
MGSLRYRWDSSLANCVSSAVPTYFSANVGRVWRPVLRFGERAGTARGSRGLTRQLRLTKAARKGEALSPPVRAGVASAPASNKIPHGPFQCDSGYAFGQHEVRNGRHRASAGELLPLFLRHTSNRRNAGLRTAEFEDQRCVKGGRYYRLATPTHPEDGVSAVCAALRRAAALKIAWVCSPCTSRLPGSLKPKPQWAHRREPESAGCWRKLTQESRVAALAV